MDVQRSPFVQRAVVYGRAQPEARRGRRFTLGPLLTPRLKEALAKVRDLFVRAPGIKLTTADTARASGLDRQVCRVLLRNLAEAGFLERRGSGVFVRRPPTPNER